MKKAMVLFIALLIAFSLISCNSSISTDSNTSSDTLSDSSYDTSTDISTDSSEDTNDNNTDTSKPNDTESDKDSDKITDSTTDTNDGGNNDDENACVHTDVDENDYCDLCDDYLIVVIDFYSINDLHGKFCDGAGQPGVDELGTYFELRGLEDEYIVLLSAGDMWQGSAESVLTSGAIMVDWMNELGFVAMTLGNHEFDWGEDPIRANTQIADFPFLAINVYNYSTGKLADYCTPSIMVERGDIKIGIIGAIGDCYSSISSDMVTDVYFKVGDELTSLVKDEATKLRENGADIIIYSIHDDTNGGNTNYDDALSNGYIDVVFEGHSHQAYVKNDSNGVVHIQGGGENYGLSHVEISINSLTGYKQVTEKNVVTNNNYSSLDDHEPTERIEDKYSEIIELAYTVLGTVSRNYNSNALADYVAQLYLEAGTKRWGDSYDVVYGGGFIKTRDPYDLYAGERTYADLLSLLPFNNKLVLCKISGSNLKSKLIENSNSSYHGAIKDGFNTSSIVSSGVYYVIVDTYTAQYRYNNLTIVEYYDETTYARDLLADAIKEGKLTLNGSGIVVKPDKEYVITPISDAIEYGNTLEIGEESTEFLYYKGTLSEFNNTKYGNCYLTDEAGTRIYVYGLKDQNNNRYDAMALQPIDGDVVIIRSTIKKYQYSSGEIIIELTNSVVVAINP